MSRHCSLFAGALCLALIIIGCENDRMTTVPVSPAISGNWGSDSLRYYISFSDAMNPGDAKNYVMFDLASVYDTSLHHSAERGTWSVSKSINGGGTWNTALADELILVPVACVDSLGATQTCASTYTMTISFANFGSDLVLNSGDERKVLQRIW
jgi:hypothetical protein